MRYLLLLIPSYIVGALIWSFLIDGTLYYCSDKMPFFDFFPPFVHGVDRGDYYIADEKAVWIAWFGFIVTILFVPYALARKFRK